jgi:phosphoribosylanthranilate isomerase
VCCISSTEEAALAIRCGADAIGLVSSMPSGPGVIPDDRIAEISTHIPPGVTTFLLTSSRDPETIVDQQKRSGVDTVQLCDELPPEAVKQLRSALPRVSIVQVVHVVDDDALDQARSAASTADALLLDSGDPNKAVKELGGTGRVHDWSLSRRIRDEVDVPVYLAGGLTPENVVDAVRQVRPYGIDVCTGLRIGGALDEGLLRKFTKNLESSFDVKRNEATGGSEK